MPSVKLTEAPWSTVQNKIAFQLSPAIYHLTDYTLAVRADGDHQALIIEIVTPSKEK